MRLLNHLEEYYFFNSSEHGIIITCVDQRVDYTTDKEYDFLDISIKTILLNEELMVTTQNSFDRVYTGQYELIDSQIFGNSLYLLERSTVFGSDHQNELVIHELDLQSGNLEKSLSLNLNDQRFIGEARLFKLDSGKLICAGSFYEDDKYLTSKGVFYTAIDAASTFLEVNSYDFKQVVMQKSLEQQYPRVNKLVNKGKEVLFSQVLIDNICELRSGQLILICQSRQFQNTDFPGSRSFRVTMRELVSSPPSYDRDNMRSGSVGSAILGISFTDNKVQWCSAIPRKIFLGEHLKNIVVVNNGNSCDVVFNDHSENSSGYSKELIWPNQSSLSRVRLSEDGDITWMDTYTSMKNLLMYWPSIDPSSDKSKYYIIKEKRCERVIRVD